MKKRDYYTYPAKFIYSPGEEIAVVFPDFDFATSGVDDEDALRSARECLGLNLYGMEEDNEYIPAPTQFSEVVASENEKTVLVDVFMPSIRMAADNRSVNRTVTLPAWLNAKACECNINFSQLLQKALKNELGV